MRSTEASAQRFVRMLLPDHAAERVGTAYELRRPDRSARLGLAAVTALAGQGVLTVGGGKCCAGPRARDWLKSNGGSANGSGGGGANAAAPLIVSDESPLARLAASIDGGAPFLLPHQVEAGERLRRLVERARLGPRVTMSYDPTRVASRGASGGGAPDVADSAIDARRKLDAIARALPGECGGVLFDVCGLLKGLQIVETERGWPRRSAKLVLRIGLEQLAGHFGLTQMAEGRASGRTRSWLDERLPLD